MNGHEENIATLRGQDPPDQFRDQQLCRARRARLTKAAGGFTPEDVGAPTYAERIFGEFGRGMLGGFTLDNAPTSRDPVLNLKPGERDISDIAYLAGHILAQAPAAFLTGLGANFGARLLLGRTLAAGRTAAAAGQFNKARALALASDALTFLAVRPAKEAALLWRVFQSGAQNAFEGIAYSLATHPVRHIDESIGHARS